MGPRFFAKRGDAVMKQRLGIKGHKGSQPFDAWSKTLTTVTLGEGHNPGTTTGTVFHLPCANWNDPLGDLDTMVSGTGQLTENRHPMDHNTAIAAGYNTVQVLSWKATITTNWILADAPLGDFMLAYTFVQNEDTEITLAAGAATRSMRLAMITSPRWTIKKFRSVQGFSENVLGSEKTVISVPNMFKYLKIINDGSTTSIPFGNARAAHVIADVAHSASPAAVDMFCTVVIFSESGLAMAIDSIHVTVAIEQKVRIMRNWLGSTDLNAGQPDIHG